MERGELLVGEFDRGQVEVLRRQRVVLLLDQPVDRLLHRQHDPQCLQLRAIGVEAPGERVLVHHAVALDIAANLLSGHGSPLGHQVRDQRQLTNELFRVLRHRPEL